MRQTRDQNCFTISEEAANWHKLIMLQNTMCPSISHVNKQCTVHTICS